MQPLTPYEREDAEKYQHSLIDNFDILVNIEKLTNVDLLRKAASMTIGKKSGITLKRAYTLGHSLMRTQMFWIELRNIPLSAAIHFCRHIHAQPYQLSKRTDRGGEDMETVCYDIRKRIYDNIEEENYDVLYDCADDVAELPTRFGRKSPTNIGLLLNAEEIVNISRARLCSKASPHTRKVWSDVVKALKSVDPDLCKFCVPSCVHQGFCRENPTCGYCNGQAYPNSRKRYLELFV